METDVPSGPQRLASGNPGQLGGIQWAYSVPARATAAHMWPCLLLECKLDTVD